MSDSKVNNVRQITKFIDPHLSLQIIDFYMNLPSYTQVKDKLIAIKAETLITKTFLFDEIEKTLKGHSSNNYNLEEEKYF